MSNHLLTLFDLKKASLLKILDDASSYKKAGQNDLVLKNKNVGMIFEKPSTRTRVSSEVAIKKLGGNSIYLSASELQLNRGESVEDTAEVLNRYLDGLIIRTKNHSHLEKFRKICDIPIINALSNTAHPLQILADFLTIRENGLDLDTVKIAYLGDGQNNICRSIMAGLSFFNGSLNIGTHRDYYPDKEYQKKIQDAGGDIQVFEDPFEAVKNADVIYTDVWVSMGNEDEEEARRKHLIKYQINMELLKYASSKAIVLHCLPANKGEEITTEVFESAQSRIFDQAENRLHTTMAVLKFLFSENQND